MKHHKLNEIPEEHVTSLFSRRFFTGENITVAFLTLRKGCIVPLHHHDSEQFSYCISGSLHFKIGGEDVILRAGEMVEIPPNVPHEAVADTEDFTGIDVFSPIRADWRDGTDAYLRHQK
jgi:quercetin dioxygenase-like cupin family protein